LHPDKKVFVSGGEDFKMYKFDYESGDELGKFFKNTLGLNPHMSFAPLY
jgi:serine-threonine kinase receptor-associated protein